MKCSQLTWHAYRNIILRAQHRCSSSTPKSLYKRTGKWAPHLKRDTILQIEGIWKESVQKHQRTRKLPEDAKKFYVLSMFPYPSGNLHMGHVRVYTISDMMARYHRSLGQQVIHPMGWDAFGLPAENAAIDRDIHPKHWTYINIMTMKRQLDDMCFSFDWDRELATCNPLYYKWTQYIFLKMYDAGLVYQKQASVNWDPVDKTVLADEQIDSQGCSWRSGAKVEKRYLRQWYIKTTAYAKSLWDGLDTVQSDLWRDVVQLQRNWIGECTSCRINMEIWNDDGKIQDIMPFNLDTPELTYGITHIVLPKSHQYNHQDYQRYRNFMDTITTTKGQYSILNLEANHPLTRQSMPIVVALHEDCHDEPHLGIPCINSEDNAIEDCLLDSCLLGQCRKNHVMEKVGDEERLINSQQFTGMDRPEAAKGVMELLRKKDIGGYPVSPKLKDWLISRQRYWGTPIPMIHCDTCKAVPVPECDLPVILPDIESEDIGKGLASLEKAKDWLNVTCPKCGRAAKRETDTMDTFVDSSWYFLRYLDPDNTTCPVDKTLADTYMPIDLYIGGKEHAYLHLYYARFINHFLCDAEGLQHREPFVNLLTQGMVKGQSYKLQDTGVYLQPDQVEEIKGKGYVQKSTGEKVVVKYEKMSKSKYNGVNPQDLLEEYGVDLTRLCILANVAPKTDRNWNIEVYTGVSRWLHRVWSLVGVLLHDRTISTQSNEGSLLHSWNEDIREQRNKSLIHIKFHLDTTFLINTAIARMMELTSYLKKVPVDVAVNSCEFERSVCDLVVLLAPMAPMVTCELWSALATVTKNTTYDWSYGVHDQYGPLVDRDAEVPLFVTMDRKNFGEVNVPFGDLNTLTKEKAFSLVEDKLSYKVLNYGIDSNLLDKADFRIKENYSATLAFSTGKIRTNVKNVKKASKGAT